MKVAEKDVTDVARLSVHAVNRAAGRYTLNQLICGFRGLSSASKFRSAMGAFFRSGQKYSAAEATRVFRQLVLLGFLNEIKVSNKMGFSNYRLMPGRAACTVDNPRTQVKVLVAVKAKKRGATASTVRHVSRLCL